MQNRQTPLIIWVATIIGCVILGANIARINPNNASDKTVSVQGEGKSSLVPDIYTFSVSANETGSTTKAVNEALALKINAAQEVLTKNNVDKKDIQSQNVDISENRVYNNNNSKVEGYRGSHSLTIKVRTIENAGKIIDDLTAIDGLLVNGGSYDNDDDSATLEAARSLAFENAKKKAEELAKLAGMKLGKPVSINETVIGGYNPPMYYAREMALSDSAMVPSTSINPGEQELAVQVNVVFELK